MPARRYASPAAFRRALTDKLKAVAQQSKWTLPQLQRQIAYDRLLERLYAVDEGWVVKGATALLARDVGVRASIDVDVFRAAALEIAERELREAAALDLGDWFRFETGLPQEASDGARGTRVPIHAFVGPTEWAAFHVDLVGNEVRMTGAPEQMPALARVTMPEVEQRGYRVYPLVDHVADKIAATCAPRPSGDRSSCRPPSRSQIARPGNEGMRPRFHARCWRWPSPSRRHSS